MDHAGAIVGPLVATAILYFAPGEYRMLFAFTAIPGAIAVALLFLVPEAATPPQSGQSKQGGQSRQSGPSRQSGTGHHGPSKLPKRLWAFLAVLFVFSLGNSADAFLLLRLSDLLGGPTYVPLLWAGLHVVKASLSTWGGALSDRIGRKRMIVTGWGLYAVVYLGFATAVSASALIAWFLLYGAYFALTEGVEKALIADLSPPSQIGAAFGFYNAALGLGTLTASVAFGFLYERLGATVAFGTGSALAGVAALLLVFVPTSQRGMV